MPFNHMTQPVFGELCYLWIRVDVLVFAVSDDSTAGEFESGECPTTSFLFLSCRWQNFCRIFDTRPTSWLLTEPQSQLHWLDNKWDLHKFQAELKYRLQC